MRNELLSDIEKILKKEITCASLRQSLLINQCSAAIGLILIYLAIKSGEGSSTGLAIGIFGMCHSLISAYRRSDRADLAELLISSLNLDLEKLKEVKEYSKISQSQSKPKRITFVDTVLVVITLILGILIGFWLLSVSK